MTISDKSQGIELGLVRRSVSDDPYAGDAFTARLFAEGLSVSREVFMFRHDWEAFAAFFEGLAAAWKGIEGEAVYTSAEHDLQIRAMSDGHGHNCFTFVLTNGPRSSWSAQVESVEIPAGEDTAALARRIALWTGPNV